MGECRGLGCLPLLGLCVRPAVWVLGWPVTVDAGYDDGFPLLWFDCRVSCWFNRGVHQRCPVINRVLPIGTLDQIMEGTTVKAFRGRRRTESGAGVKVTGTDCEVE
ncbi:hypothetical protein QR685DRAFT_3059 [Neurospora intermedia]|uniref:Secreted protein n=1 Tax=Neurospora intermedia TaxID=5142 RepID=A0ABR3DNL8_NEUIN